MAKREVLIIVAIVSMVCASEVEDIEQKKRGAGKTASLNSIPTGAQKTDYTYTIYSQNPSSQSSSPSQSYQSQVPNSFYPSQGNQYYSQGSGPTEVSGSYPHQPQVNLIPPPTSQFVPLNFVPNPGYQSKYQIVPPKSQNGIQLVLQQPANFQSPLLPYSQSLFSPNPSSQINPQQNHLLGALQSQGHYNVPTNYPQLSLGSPYLGHSSMLLLAQPNPSLYSNLLYPNIQSPVPSFYNYYPTNSQARYNIAYGSSQQATAEYDRPGPVSQSIGPVAPKEDNDIGVSNTDYVSQSADSNSNYKNAYAASRSSSYSKLK